MRWLWAIQDLNFRLGIDCVGLLDLLFRSSSSQTIGGYIAECWSSKWMVPYIPFSYLSPKLWKIKTNFLSSKSLLAKVVHRFEWMPNLNFRSWLDSSGGASHSWGLLFSLLLTNLHIFFNLLISCWWLYSRYVHQCMVCFRYTFWFPFSFASTDLEWRVLLILFGSCGAQKQGIYIWRNQWTYSILLEQVGKLSQIT
jgi:hypothetical protein